MMNYQRTPCRCKKCFTRKTLKRHPDNYIIIPACPCGSKEWYVDHWRIKNEWGIQGCECHGYGFPHRKTSGWCVYGEKFDPGNYEEWLSSQPKY